MLLTISTTHEPATDLGYLLHKHPDRQQTFELAFGDALVYYPEADEQRCTAVLLLTIDPVKLVRSFKGVGGARSLEHYVNDRPYVASSFMSVAIAQVFNTALAGRCQSRQALADSPIPLQAKLAVLPCRGGEKLLRELFEPLCYEINLTQHPLNASIPDWGDSAYFTVTLSGQKRLRDLLRHLYVLIPVLDREKHYWIGDDEVDKLLRHGEDWLATHPQRDLIANRYLKFRRSLTRQAIEQLQTEETGVDDDEANPDAEEEALEKPISLNQQRLDSVIEVIKENGAQRVIDFGCGEGRLLGKLLRDTRCSEIVGVDVSSARLEIAENRLRLERMPERQRQRIKLLQGSLLYRDSRLKGYDAAAVIEVIEHLELDRLEAFERALFGHAQPGLIVVTTPNIEYNVKFETMRPGQLRHNDHRFEWTRQEFQDWAKRVAEHYGYQTQFRDIGEVDAELGPPTQMVVFSTDV